MDLRKNGKSNGTPQIVLPYVTVLSNPANASPQNPNGVIVTTNMRDPSGKPPQLVMIQILSEAIHLLAKGIENTAPVSASLVLPDGSPAPLPTENAPQGG